MELLSIKREPRFSNPIWFTESSSLGPFFNGGRNGIHPRNLLDERSKSTSWFRLAREEGINPEKLQFLKFSLIKN
jgi:hypothetical protein